MPRKILICSGPIRSGKTSALLQLIVDIPRVSGILTPDAEGVRQLYLLATRQYVTFENRRETGPHTVEVGRFSFYKQAFSLAGKSIAEVPAASRLHIIDEVGKLEIFQEKGLEPAVGTIIKKFVKGEIPDCTLLIVVRDTLLDAFLEKYALQPGQFEQIASPYDFESVKLALQFP